MAMVMDHPLMLFKAAKDGNTMELLHLLQADPLILEDLAGTGTANSPLHIAAMLGHVGFVTELINHKRTNVVSYVKELNQRGFSPMHLASANGHTEVVKELLKVSTAQELCSLKGRDGLIPLHCASMKGRVDAIRELLEASPASASAVTVAGETAVHVAVRNNQNEALRALVEGLKVNNMLQVLESTDEEGNTVLHLAAATRNREVIKVLLDSNTQITNATNKKGLTALDLFLLSCSCSCSSYGGDHQYNYGHNAEIERLLRQAAEPVAVNEIILQAQPDRVHKSNPSSTNLMIPDPEDSHNSPEMCKEDYLEIRDLRQESPSELRGMLLVVLSLMVTATYQGILSPPGGLEQDGPNKGQAVMASEPGRFFTFTFFNSAGFFISLNTIWVLIYKLPWRSEIYIATTSMIVSYGTATEVLSPPGKLRNITTWIVTALSVFLPILSWLLRKCYRCLRKNTSRRRRHRRQQQQQQQQPSGQP